MAAPDHSSDACVTGRYRDGVPLRPPNHVLETASEKAFWNAIRDEWVFTQTGKSDYGIDGRVEIFMPATAGDPAQTTGLAFNVQLKATADESSDAMRVGVSWDHIAYWQSLAEPVLVVRYIASTQTLYAMWAHDRGREREAKPTKQGWFRFRESDLLSVECADEIVADVEAYRAARSGRVRLPVVLRFSGDRATALLEAAWNAQLAERLGDKIRLAKSSPSALRARLDDALTVDFGGGMAFTLHQGGAVGDPYTVDDLLIVLATCLGRVRAVHDAATCLRACESLAALWAPGALAFAVACCIDADELELAVELIEACPAPALVPGPIRLVTQYSDRLDGPLRTRISHIQDRLVCQPGTDEERGRALLDRAMVARSFGDHPAAVTYLDRAREVWPDFGNQSDFWVHRAGSAFLTGKIGEAATSYEAAIAAGDNSDFVRANCADALLLAGRYRDVIDLVSAAERWLPDERLTYYVAGFVIDRFGVSYQERDQDPDLGRAASAAHTEEELRSVAERDALVPGIWFDLQRVVSGDGETNGPHPIEFLIAARLVDTDATMWASAISYGHLHGVDEALLWAAAARAKKRVGPGFIDVLIQHAELLTAPYSEPDVEPPDFEPLFELVNRAESFSYPDPRNG